MKLDVVVAWINQRRAEGVSVGDFCFIVRSRDQVNRALAAADKANLDVVALKRSDRTDPNKASICHNARSQRTGVSKRCL